MPSTTEKKSKRNPTPRQRKAAKEVVENLMKDEPLPTGQVLENVGYSKGVSETPSMVLETQGFKDALSETGLREALIAQGINPKKIAEKIDVLLDAKNGENADYNAIDKGLKHATAIYGVLGEKPPETKNTYNFIFDANVQGEIKKMEDNIKSLLTQNVPQSKETMEAQSEEPRSTGEVT
jgi:hypothetical protein